jgi:MOSC domain-containing protein YiiM
MNASVERIYVVGEHGGEPKRIDCAEAVAETGLRGDRHFGSEGSDLTLIAREAIDAVEREYGIALNTEAHRRNVTVVGADLSALVGEQFRMGEAVRLGTGRCKHCSYLETHLGRADLTEAMAGRGGLRCRVVDGGPIAVGDGFERQ